MINGVLTTRGAVIGLVIMLVSEVATLARIEPFWSWNTPICWTGFILFADAIVFRARSNSWMRSAPREFALLAISSIPLWLIFEFYNLYIDNWYYVGLPEHFWLRMLGYAWSFGTIWPAIFEAADLVAVLRAGKAGRSGHPAPPAYPPHPARPAYPAHPALWILVGTLMLTVPLVVQPTVARYLAAPVWLGFIFLLEPINARLGAETLTRERLINLGSSGLVCGVLWEFWNFWSRSKWHYSVPIMEHLKIFEMPVPGYLGFPAFAFECFTMYVFVRALFLRVAAGLASETSLTVVRPIAL
jgi:hypothetical protein